MNDSASALNGAPLMINRSELETKIAQTNTAYNAFDADLRQKTVFLGAPTEFEEALLATDATPDEKTQLLAWYNTTHLTKVEEAAKNAQGKTSEQINTERSFASAWLKVDVRWRIFFLRNGKVGAFDHLFNLGDVWDAVDRYNSELKDWQKKAASDLGLKTTAPEVRTEPGGALGLGIQIPWKLIIGVGVAYLAVTKGPEMIAKWEEASTRKKLSSAE